MRETASGRGRRSRTQTRRLGREDRQGGRSAHQGSLAWTFPLRPTTANWIQYFISNIYVHTNTMQHNGYWHLYDRPINANTCLSSKRKCFLFATAPFCGLEMFRSALMVDSCSLLRTAATSSWVSSFTCRIKGKNHFDELSYSTVAVLC